MATSKKKQARGRPRKYNDDGTPIEQKLPATGGKYAAYREYYKQYQSEYRKRNRERINAISRAHDKRKRAAKQLAKREAADE